MGRYGTKPCIVTLVERKTGYLMIGKLEARTKDEANRRILQLINRCSDRFETITADNGTEFHGYEDIERTDRREVLLRAAVPLVGARHQ